MRQTTGLSSRDPAASRGIGWSSRVPVTLRYAGRRNRVSQVVTRALPRMLCDEASYVNGAKWEIDGGALATIRNDI